MCGRFRLGWTRRATTLTQVGSPSKCADGSPTFAGCYDITTTAAYVEGSEILVCLPYDPNAVDNPEDLEIFHWEEDGTRTSLPVVMDPDDDNTICVVTTSLSPFAVALKPRQQARY